MLIASQSLSATLHYSQFHVWDEGEERDDCNPLSDEAMERGFFSSERFLCVFTAGETSAPIVFERHDQEPETDFAGWDRVFEISLYLPGGHVQVHECTGIAVQDFEVAVGWSRFRVYCSGMDAASQRGTGEQFLLRVWPAPNAPSAVLKQWSGASVP